MSDRIMNWRKTRRRPTSSEKYEMFVSLLTAQGQRSERPRRIGRWSGRPWCTCVGSPNEDALNALAASVPGAARAEWLRGGRAARAQARSNGCTPRSPSRHWRCSCKMAIRMRLKANRSRCGRPRR